MVSTSAHRDAEDQKDTAQFERLLTKFREVHGKLSEVALVKPWNDKEGRREIEKYIRSEVSEIINEMI